MTRSRSLSSQLDFILQLGYFKAKHLFFNFADFGKLRFKSEDEQNIRNECSRLLTNCILYYNLAILSELFKRAGSDTAELERIKRISPTAWQHVNFMGRYEFEKPKAEISILETVDRIQMLPMSNRLGNR